MPASRETMCGESEQAPGEKYSFMTRTSWDHGLAPFPLLQ